MPNAFWTAPAERQRRRRFRNGAAHSIGQTRSVATTRSTAVSRPTCHRSPKSRRVFPPREILRNCFGLRRQSAAATALSKRSGSFDWSDPLGRYHTLESGVALRLPPHSKLAEGVLDCAGRAQRRRRFRNGAAHSIGQTRSVATTRSTAVSRPTCHRSPKSPASFHACQQNPVAACPGTPTECSGNLLCHGQHVFAPASFQGKGQASRVASRVA